MQTMDVVKIDGQMICYNAQILPQIDPQFFDPDWHRSQGNIHGSAPGRGQALFLRAQGHELVLRPFRRGGLIGKINADLYLRIGAKYSRAFREYRLLEWMRSRGLPVPNPVAARYAPSGLCYRADLITERIPQARPLADILLETPLAPPIWTKIGDVIRRMHVLGVHHSDLNCRNILLDADMQVWLIDFDKCRRRRNTGWQQHNLSRLRRSLTKEKTKHPELHWSDTDWSTLGSGYDRDDQ